MTDTLKREFDLLEKAGLVVLALQLAIFAKLWSDFGFDQATDDFPLFIIMATSLFIAAQRKLGATPPNRGAARWILASRVAALAMLAFGTLVVGYYGLVPRAAPPPEFVPRALVALMWTIIALKGAGVGKLKPGGPFGLRVSWTLQSRLAWDRAHRLLGRVLFFGGIVGLAASLVAPLLTSAVMWLLTVGLAVTSALLEGRRSWRSDPDRGRPG
jgi:uncharacterized membrane protein